MARTARKVLDIALGAAKNVKSFSAVSWRYLKVEAVPPFTADFFSGPAGAKIENFAEKMADGFIGTIAGRIKEIDAEEERARLELAAAIKAREEKLKAEAKRKEEERKKAAAEKAAAEAKKASAKAAEQQAAQKAAKPAEKPKEKPKEAPKKSKKKDKKQKKKKNKKPPKNKK